MRTAVRGAAVEGVEAEDPIRGEEEGKTSLYGLRRDSRMEVEREG